MPGIFSEGALKRGCSGGSVLEEVVKRIRLLAVVSASAVLALWKQVADIDSKSVGNAIQRLEGRICSAVLYASNLVRMDAGHESEFAQAHPRSFSVAEDVKAELCLVCVECDHVASVRTLRLML